MASQAVPTLRVEDILTAPRPCRSFSRQLLAPLVQDIDTPANPSQGFPSTPAHAQPSASPVALPHRGRYGADQLSPLSPAQVMQPQQGTITGGNEGEQVQVCAAEKEAHQAQRVLEAVRLLTRSVEVTREGFEVSAMSVLSTAQSPQAASPFSSASRSPSHQLPMQTLPHLGSGGWRRGSGTLPAFAGSTFSMSRAGSTAGLDGERVVMGPLPICPHTLLYLLHLLAARTSWTSSSSSATSRGVWLEVAKQIALYFALLDSLGLGDLVADVLLFGEPRLSPAWEAQQLNLYSLPASTTEPGARAPFHFYRCDCDDGGGEDDSSGCGDDVSTTSAGSGASDLDGHMAHGRPYPRRLRRWTRRAGTSSEDEATITATSSSRSPSPLSASTSPTATSLSPSTAASSHSLAFSRTSLRVASPPQSAHAHPRLPGREASIDSASTARSPPDRGVASSCAVHPDKLTLSQHFQLVLYRLMDSHGASEHCAPAASTIRSLSRSRTVLMVLLALPLSSAVASAAPPSPQPPTSLQSASQPPPLPNGGLTGGSTGSASTPMLALMQTSASLAAGIGFPAAPSGNDGRSSRARPPTYFSSPHHTSGSAGRGHPAVGTSWRGAHHNAMGPGSAEGNSRGREASGEPATAVAVATPIASTFIGHLLPFLTHRTLSVCTQSWRTLRHVLSQDPALAAPFLLYYMQEIVFDVILAHALHPAATAPDGSTNDTTAYAAEKAHAVENSTFTQTRVATHFIAQQESLSLLVHILREAAYLEAQTRYRLSPAILCGLLTLISNYYTIVRARDEQWQRRRERQLRRNAAAKATAPTRAGRHAVSGVSSFPDGVPTAQPSPGPLAAPLPAASDGGGMRSTSLTAPGHADGLAGLGGGVVNSTTALNVTGHDPPLAEGSERGSSRRSGSGSSSSDTEDGDALDGLGDVRDVTSVLDLVPYRHRTAMRLCLEALCEFIVQQDKSIPIRYLLLTNMSLIRAFIDIAVALPPPLFSHEDGDSHARGAAETLDRRQLLHLLNAVTPLTAEESYEMNL